jgi:hypothetical protein
MINIDAGNAGETCLALMKKETSIMGKEVISSTYENAP